MKPYWIVKKTRSIKINKLAVTIAKFDADCGSSELDYKPKLFAVMKKHLAIAKSIIKNKR